MIEDVHDRLMVVQIKPKAEINGDEESKHSERLHSSQQQFSLIFVCGLGGCGEIFLNMMKSGEFPLVEGVRYLLPTPKIQFAERV